MKKVLLAALATLSIVSCSTPESKAREALKAEVNKITNDPGSFEINDLISVDTINNTQILLNRAQSMLEFNQEQLSTYELEKNSDYWHIYEDIYDDTKVEIEEYNERISELEKQMTEPELIERHTFSVRGKNKLGALVVSKAYVDKNIKTAQYEVDIK
jgi:phage-related protein